MSETTVNFSLPAIELTTGRLDGLQLNPCANEEGNITHVHATVATLPGLRIILEYGACCELRDALNQLLGPCEGKDHVVRDGSGPDE